MKYYVVADTHGFYTKLREALERAGFFADTSPHRLILCGDMMDRGAEAVELQRFMMDLLRRGELIFIRGNHEDLMESMLEDLSCMRPLHSAHRSNGTWDTLLQLTGFDETRASYDGELLVRRARATDFVRRLMPASLDYFETEHYVFVHGWIPAYPVYPEGLNPEVGLCCRPDWREASRREWEMARWHNGMERCCLDKYGLAHKTIVCGHFHASYGHAKIDRCGSEFGRDADFTPFYDEGVIGLDACTAYSGFINCIVLED